MCTRPALPALLIYAAVVAAMPRPALADREIFEITELQTSGRAVTAEFADFDGDGLDDLMIATLDGVPPDESRLIHVYFAEPDGSFPRLPSASVPIPEHSAVYDIADLRDTPGDEMIVLRPEGVTIISLASNAPRQWDRWREERKDGIGGL